MTRLRSGSATDVGKVRTSNQDVALEDPDLFAVADGMGGHVGGEVAARVAVDTLRAAFQRDRSVEGLRRAVAEANRAVWSQGQTESGLRGMGTTLTATALIDEADGQVIALANVGDSRAYVFSGGQVIQVTADHSLAEEKVRQGQLTEAEAAVHPHRHILTRALGVSSDVDVDLWKLHLHDGDRILLCSDGLTNEVGDEQIGRILGSVKTPTEAAQALVKAALDHGGNDNVTCVVVDVIEAGPPSDSTRPSATAEAEAASSAIAAGAATAVTSALPQKINVVRGGSPSTDATSSEVADRVDRSGAHSRGGEGRSAEEPSGSAPTRTVRMLRSGAVVRPADSTDAAGAIVKPVGLGSRSAGGAHNGANVANGGAGHAPGAASAARLQAAQLRRLQPTRGARRRRRRLAGAPRLITVRVVLFLVLVAAVIAAAYAALRWYSMDDWYVAVDHGHLAVYRGRPGGFLWFKPHLVEETAVTTSGVLPFAVPHDRQEPSLSAAKAYIRNLHQEYVATRRPSGSTASGSTSSGSTASGSSSSGSTTPGTASGQGGGSTSAVAGAFAPPVAVWQ